MENDLSNWRNIMKRIFCLMMGALFLFNLVNVSALNLVVHVPEKYTDVVAGERFYFEVEVKYPENPSRKDLRLEYEILTQNGELVAQSKALKAIETQASFIDFIVIPEGSDPGFHIVNVKVKDYESLSEEVSASFNIKKAGGDEILLYLIAIIGAIILVGILVILTIVLKKK